MCAQYSQVMCAQYSQVMCAQYSKLNHKVFAAK